MQAVGTKISRQVAYGITSGLFVYGWLSVNIYLPILPQLDAALDTTVTAARLTVTVFLVGFALLDLLTTMSTLSVLVPMSVFIFGTGLVSPAANTGAMTLFRDKAGAATSIVGSSIALGGAIFSGALSAIHITRLVELGAYVGVSALLTLALFMLLLRRNQTPDTGQ